MKLLYKIQCFQSTSNYELCIMNSFKLEQRIKTLAFCMLIHFPLVRFPWHTYNITQLLLIKLKFKKKVYVLNYELNTFYFKNLHISFDFFFVILRLWTVCILPPSGVLRERGVVELRQCRTNDPIICTCRTTLPCSQVNTPHMTVYFRIMRSGWTDHIVPL